MKWRSLRGGIGGGEQGEAPFLGYGREWPGMVDRHVPWNGGPTPVLVFVIWVPRWAAGSRAAGQPGSRELGAASRELAGVKSASVVFLFKCYVYLLHITDYFLFSIYHLLCIIHKLLISLISS